MVGIRDTFAETGPYDGLLEKYILTDHANAFSHFINRFQHARRELIEHQVQFPEKRAKRLPVIVLVVGIENEGVGDLALKVLYDRMIFPVFLRNFFD
jgi:hypothetical protein